MSLVIEDNVELNEGELICSKCEGKMCIEDDDGAIGTCDKCLGKGKVDWVTNAMPHGFKGIKPGVYAHEIDYSKMSRKRAIKRLLAHAKTLDW